MIAHIIAQEVALSPAVQQRQGQKVCRLSLLCSTAADREPQQHAEQSKQLLHSFS